MPTAFKITLNASIVQLRKYGAYTRTDRKGGNRKQTKATALGVYADHDARLRIIIYGWAFLDNISNVLGLDTKSVYWASGDVCFLLSTAAVLPTRVFAPAPIPSSSIGDFHDD